MKIHETFQEHGIWSLTAVARILVVGVLTIASSGSPGPAQETSPPASEDTSGGPTGFFTEVMDVRVINVDVFVNDRTGVSIAGLGREDFELRVDGTPVSISNFYAATRPGSTRSFEVPGSVSGRAGEPSFRPIETVEAEAARRAHVVILIDHTRLRSNNRKRAFAALRKAISRLGQEDLIAVVGIEGSLVFYSDFLYDREAVGRILDDVSRVGIPSELNEAERRQIFGELARGMSGGILARSSEADQQAIQIRIQAYAAQEYARGISSLRSIEQVVTTLSGVSGRKAVLYVGEGIPTRPGEGLFVEWRNRFGASSDQLGVRRIDFNTDYTRAVGRYELNAQITDLAASANAAGVTLYAVDAQGNHGNDIRSALTEQGATSETLSVVDENFRAPLEAASKATGGRLLRSSGQLVDQLVKLLGDFESYYSLGFTPPAEWQPGSVHDIRVKVAGKGFRVRYREAVRIPEPDEREASATVAALRYQTANNPLQIRATPAIGITRDDGTEAVPVTIEIPLSNLELLPRGGTYAGSVTIYVSTERADGNASQVQKIPFKINIPDEVIEQARLDSAHYDLPLVLRKGDRKVAIGIRDNISGRFSAVRVDVSRFAPSS